MPVTSIIMVTVTIRCNFSLIPYPDAQKTLLLTRRMCLSDLTIIITCLVYTAVSRGNAPSTVANVLTIWHSVTPSESNRRCQHSCYPCSMKLDISGIFD